MIPRELLVLSLRAPLPYRGLENPPLAGLPSPEEAGRLLSALGRAPEAAEEALPEGGEELFAFEAEALLAFDPEEGPRAVEALPAPAFYGRAAGPGTELRSLPAGRYLFLQLRPRGEGELLEALEWFARESWWEGQATSGPYFLRRVQEDGKLATQILRRLEN